MALPLLSTMMVPSNKSTTITGTSHHRFRSFRYLKKSLRNSFIVYPRMVNKSSSSMCALFFIRFEYMECLPVFLSRGSTSSAWPGISLINEPGYRAFRPGAGTPDRVARNRGSWSRRDPQKGCTTVRPDRPDRETTFPVLKIRLNPAG